MVHTEYFNTLHSALATGAWLSLHLSAAVPSLQYLRTLVYFHQILLLKLIEQGCLTADLRKNICYIM